MWKNSLRVEVYGTLDELTAVVGVVRVMNAEMLGSHVQAEQLEEDLQWIQNKLFDLGGILATVPGQPFKNMSQVPQKDVTKLEKIIDRCQKDLAPLKEFNLPGRGMVSGCFQQARTVCRRAERVCVQLSREELVDAVHIMFVNRLSDALSVLARWTAKSRREPAFLWQRDVKKVTG